VVDDRRGDRLLVLLAGQKSVGPREVPGANALSHFHIPIWSTVKDLAGLALVLAIASALAGCAAAPGDTLLVDSEISLAESKSPTQLLRNEAASRLPAEAIESLSNNSDESIPCFGEGADPEGVVRAWHSSLEATLVAESETMVDELVAELIASFTADNWLVQDVDFIKHVDGDGGRTIARSGILTSQRHATKIQVAGLTPDAVDAPVSILIDAYGPCVRTDGANSQEVRTLEGAG
jgi:hypothetical protein